VSTPKLAPVEAKPESKAKEPESKAMESAAAEPKATQPKATELAIPRSVSELRAARRRVLQRRFGIFVGIPTLIAIIYYGFVATPQYDAWTVVAIESNEGRAKEEAGLASTTGNQRDARALREALRGSQALAAADRDGAFRAHYRGGGDWMTRLSADSGTEATLDYFRDKVTVTHEPGTNLLSVRVRAFSGDGAHDFASRLVDYARTWVAHQNTSSSSARLQLAQTEVERAHARVAAAMQALAKAGPDPRPTDPAMIEHHAAEKQLEVALGGLQEAQAEVGRAARYLVVLDGPSHPDAAAAPRRAWGIASVFIGALVLVSLLSLLGASIREHAKF
jgi:capsule polysaccharide export protein KpsE/RkpR